MNFSSPCGSRSTAPSRSLDQAALDQRAQSLVIQRCLAQELGRQHRLLQIRDRLEQLGLARRAPAQLFHLIAVDLARGLNEQLFLPADLGAPDDLRQQAAHDGFDRAAVIGAHPARQLEQLFAQDRRIAHDRFDRPNSLRRRCDRGEQRLWPERTCPETARARANRLRRVPTRVSGTR